MALKQYPEPPLPVHDAGMKAPLLSLPSQGEVLDAGRHDPDQRSVRGQRGIEVWRSRSRPPTGLGTMTTSATPPMLPSKTMLPPVPKTEPGMPLTMPAVPSKVIELTVGTTGVGTIEDGRSPAGGAKNSRPVGGASVTPPSMFVSGLMSATRSW